MKSQAIRAAAVLAVLGLVFASLPANANWRKGDAKDIRIELNHPEFPGRYGIDVSVYDRGGGSIPAQSDHVFSGNLQNASVPYILGNYESATKFKYEHIKESLKSYGMFEGASIEYMGGVMSATSAITDVEYIKFKFSSQKLGVSRSCGFWLAFFSGNRFIYSGVYCPANRDVTDDDMKTAVNSIVIIKKP